MIKVIVQGRGPLRRHEEPLGLLDKNDGRESIPSMHSPSMRRRDKQSCKYWSRAAAFYLFMIFFFCSLCLVLFTYLRLFFFFLNVRMCFCMRVCVSAFASVFACLSIYLSISIYPHAKNFPVMKRRDKQSDVMWLSLFFIFVHKLALYIWLFLFLYVFFMYICLCLYFLVFV